MPELRATLRLQFHAGFTFDDAVGWLDYFRALGISHLYASPILTAVPGSSHGYDLTDPRRINPELGGEAGYRRLVQALRRRDMGILLDVVANHMAIGKHNAWWQDVLRWGRHSEHAGFFDIDWEAGDGRVVLPILPDHYGRCLHARQLRVICGTGHDLLRLQTSGQSLPLSPFSYHLLLVRTGDPALMVLGARLLTAAESPHPRASALPLLAELTKLSRSPARRQALQQAADHFSMPDDRFAERLHNLLQSQPYRLVYWRSGADLLNWRRFFDINELAAVRAQTPEVFGTLHAAFWPLARDQQVDGLRIDHIDGLADPRAYCQRLRRHWRRHASDAPCPYLFVEKILATGETLPCDWHVHGTTGYDFMEQVSLLLHDLRGADLLTRLWQRISGADTDVARESCRARRLLLDTTLACDLTRTAAAFAALARDTLETLDISQAAITRALRELTAHFPVYRIYDHANVRRSHDRRWLMRAATAARATLRREDHGVLQHLLRWLTADHEDPALTDDRRAQLVRAGVLFRQLTAPVAAKGVEDTLCYRHGVLLSRNEVGADLDRLGGSLAEFHQQCARRARDLPESLLCTATHDHKRGEDHRARLAVISEQPRQFAADWQQWRDSGAALRLNGAPVAADEMLLCQTLLGSWPMTLNDRQSEAAGEFLARLRGWFRKALREGRLRSSWQAPDERYEACCDDFLVRLFNDPDGAGLWSALHRSATRLMRPGALNSLTQCLLRLTVPGVPDLYQGTEFWDFSLVDPDNRRPVDFNARQRAFQAATTPADLLARWRDGHLKQWLISRLLQYRARYPALFRHGDYTPLAVAGEPERVVAFLRRYQDQALLVAAPRCVSEWLAESELPQVPAACWGEASLSLPSGLDGDSFVDLLTGRRLATSGGQVPLATLLASWPVTACLGRCDAPNTGEADGASALAHH